MDDDLKFGAEVEVADGVLTTANGSQFVISEDALERLVCSCGKKSSILLANGNRCIPSCSNCVDRYRKEGFV